jgi:hypothetical protein
MTTALRCRVCDESQDDPSYGKCYRCRRDHDTLVQHAAQQYATDDINVDADARLSRVDNGVWVQAWVFVSNEET